MFHLFFLVLTQTALLSAQTEKKNFIAALGGLATLSGDAQSNFSAGAIASFYSQRNGAALNLAAGHHFNDWVSLQGNYVWNRNEVTLSGVNGASFYASRNATRHHQAILDGMLYVRPLSSRIRPYLSAGVGMANAARKEEVLLVSANTVASPAKSAGEWYPALRFAVGIDLMLPSRWGFRYSFSESLTDNLFSRGLLPPAQKKLMNFQNLWGVVKYF